MNHQVLIKLLILCIKILFDTAIMELEKKNYNPKEIILIVTLYQEKNRFVCIKYINRTKN